MFEAFLYFISSYLIIFSAGLATCSARLGQNYLRAALYILTACTAVLGLLGMLVLWSLAVLPGVTFLSYSLPVYLLVLIALSVLVSKKLAISRTANDFVLKRTFLIFVLLVLPLLPYGIVETQTSLIGPQLVDSAKEALKQTGWYVEPVEISDLKILFATPNHILVYVVTPAKSGYCADIIDLAKRCRGPKYRLSGWSTVWSDSGSAHGIIFPPYPSKGEF
ncbi:MAG: hypothetical protein ACYC2Y_07700 [Armatimonadota bacterium]